MLRSFAQSCTASAPRAPGEPKPAAVAPVDLEALPVEGPNLGGAIEKPRQQLGREDPGFWRGLSIVEGGVLISEGGSVALAKTEP